MKFKVSRIHWRTLPGRILVLTAVMVGVLVTGSAYAWYFSGRIVPHTSLGAISLGGLNRDQAAERVQAAIDAFNEEGIQLVIDDTTEIIQPSAIGFDMNLAEVVDAAFARGHVGGRVTQIWQRLAASWSHTRLEVPVRFDPEQLASELDDVAISSDIARRDIRLSIVGAKVQLLTDTKAGRVIDRARGVQLISRSLAELSSEPIPLTLVDDEPRADIVLAGKAVTDAQNMISRALGLQYEDIQFYVSRDRIGSWIRSDYNDTQLIAAVDRAAIGQYVTSIAQTLNIAPEPPSITTDGGRVTGFVPMKVGRAVEEDNLVALIIAKLQDRTDKDRAGDTVVIPMKTSKMSLSGLDSASGITELIGKATTPFTGSPKNRISNIKNGVKFLSGSIVQPGEEFSTLGTLGTIDNTTGYLPELVIKGDRTTPEFGGGLCQVSTTLFRAVMDTGLPITARRNHSYRVSYYEKDGTGRVIGPGLDATIYEPDLDFRFRNDTAHQILIIGYVVGDKVTFELYGTKDGRTSSIAGPTLLTETTPGDPVYIPTDTLPLGVTKQVETPHPGGSTVATYSITYADGHTVPQEFRSYYRRWPAKYLIGAPPEMLSPSPVVSEKTP